MKVISIKNRQICSTVPSDRKFIHMFGKYRFLCNTEQRGNKSGTDQFLATLGFDRQCSSQHSSKINFTLARLAVGSARSRNGLVGGNVKAVCREPVRARKHNTDVPSRESSQKIERLLDWDTFSTCRVRIVSAGYVP